MRFSEMDIEKLTIVRNKIIDTIAHHESMTEVWKKCEEFLRKEIEKHD